MNQAIPNDIADVKASSTRGSRGRRERFNPVAFISGPGKKTFRMIGKTGSGNGSFFGALSTLERVSQPRHLCTYFRSFFSVSGA